MPRAWLTGGWLAGAWTAAALSVAGLTAPANTAVAQSTTPAPAAQADPAFDAAKAAAQAMGADAFAAIQQDLIWTGDLNSLPSGDMGKRSYDAIRAFQKRIKVKDSGILTPEQRRILAQHAARFTDRYGFTTITERGLLIGYPAKLATQRKEGKSGTNFSSPKGDVSIDVLALPVDKESFEDLFARMKGERAGRKVTYSLLRPDFFVVSGVNDGKSFYLRFIRTPGAWRGIAIGWDPALSPAFDRIPIAMASALKPADDAPKPAPAQQDITPKLPSVPASPPEPAKPAGPPVPLPDGAPRTARSGLGAVISDRDDILTYADVVAGCESVAIQGGGTAKVIGGDRVNNIALVRAISPTGLSPLAWRSEPLAANEAVFLLSGTPPVASTVTALADPGGDTRRLTLSVGGSGVLIDGNGALVGLAAENGDPTALKAVFAMAFMRANAAAPPLKGGDPAKAAVKLTCTPK